MSIQMLKQKISFEFVDATIGKNIERYSRFISNRSFEYLTSGSVGCWVSHFRVWQKIANNKHGYYIVLEDDVILFDNVLKNISKILDETLIEFDILFLATGNNYKRNKRYFINNKIFVPYHLRNGAYSYVLTPKGAKKLIDLIPSVKVTRGGIDSAIGVLIRNHKLLAYHLDKPLCQVTRYFGSFTRLNKNEFFHQ